MMERAVAVLLCDQRRVPPLENLRLVTTAATVAVIPAWAMTQPMPARICLKVPGKFGVFGAHAQQTAELDPGDEPEASKMVKYHLLGILWKQ